LRHHFYQFHPIDEILARKQVVEVKCRNLTIYLHNFNWYWLCAPGILPKYHFTFRKVGTVGYEVRSNFLDCFLKVRAICVLGGDLY